MNTCPHIENKLRPGLPPLTRRIASLKIDERGYPIPWFVDYIDGKPDFRVIDRAKLVRAVKDKLCWVCGDPLGKYLSFTIGPMCAINRTTAEPPEHLDCAEWSVQGCPFLSNANMKRREDDFTRENEKNVAGLFIKRNPGAMCIWTALGYKRFNDGRGGVLFNIGEPVSVTWWKEGRPATRAEVEESIRTGLPALEEAVAMEKESERPAARAALAIAHNRMLQYLPKL